MTATQSKTPKGKTYLNLFSSGDVSATDAEALMKDIAPGMPNANLPILAIVAEGAKFSPEARQAFTKMNSGDAQQAPVAVVVSSAPLRVMLGFIIRLSGASAVTKFFGAEADALAWLEEKLASP